MSDELTLAERRALAAWSPLAPPADFADRVLDARGRSRRTLVLGAGVACAAAAVALVLASARAPQPSGEEVAPPAPRPGYIPVTEIDASIGPLPPDADDSAERSRAGCRRLLADRKWQDLLRCADRLAALDPAAARRFADVANAETAADIARARMETELGEGNLRTARTYLRRIPEDSVYRNAAQQTYDRVERKMIDELRARAIQLSRHHRCQDLERLVVQAGVLSSSAADAVRPSLCTNR